MTNEELRKFGAALGALTEEEFQRVYAEAYGQSHQGDHAAHAEARAAELRQLFPKSADKMIAEHRRARGG